MLFVYFTLQLNTQMLQSQNLLLTMFVDTNRGMAVVMGETDNKKALDQRKKKLLKEKRKYGLGANVGDEEVVLPWDSYYSKVTQVDQLKTVLKLQKNFLRI